MPCKQLKYQGKGRKSALFPYRQNVVPMRWNNMIQAGESAMYLTLKQTAEKWGLSGGLYPVAKYIFSALRVKFLGHSRPAERLSQTLRRPRLKII